MEMMHSAIFKMTLTGLRGVWQMMSLPHLCSFFPDCLLSMTPSWQTIQILLFSFHIFSLKPRDNLREELARYLKMSCHVIYCDIKCIYIFHNNKVCLRRMTLSLNDTMLFFPQFGLLHFHSLCKYVSSSDQVSLIFKTRTYWFLI